MFIFSKYEQTTAIISYHQETEQSQNFTLLLYCDLIINTNNGYMPSHKNVRSDQKFMATGSYIYLPLFEHKM